MVKAYNRITLKAKRLVKVLGVILSLYHTPLLAQIYAPEIRVQETSGKIGIGRAPSSEVEIDVEDGLGLEGTSEIRFNSRAVFGYDGGINKAAYITAKEGKRIIFKTDGENERVRIDRNGFVGIGTTNPPSILSINSTNIHANTNETTYGRFTGNDDIFTLESPSNKPIINMISRFPDSQSGANLGGIWWTRTKGQSDAHRQVAGIYATQYGTNLPGGAIYLAAKNPGTGTVRTMKFDGNGRLWVQSTQVWPDFVFAQDYSAPSLSSVEKFIRDHNHLPGIPSEAEVKEKGIDLASMDAKLLQKIEELTLYLIEQNKEIAQLRSELEQIKQNQK